MTAKDNEQLIHEFYQAFQRRDVEAMAACYHEQVHFSDPMFPNLHGHEAGQMWKSLLSGGTDLTLTYENVRADEKSGSARWIATYHFSLTGRKVVNVVDAAFEFQDGKIIRHTDTFSFSKWARMAFGWPGVLAGWTGSFQKKIRESVEKNFRAFVEKQGK
jgi:ketosteroid isomerase-like protein